MPWLEPVTLQGERLRLEPVETRHMDRLLGATDRGTFQYFTSQPALWTAEAMWDWIQTRTAPPFVAMAMIDASAGAVVGCSTFFDADERHRKLEVGYTWIERGHRGGWVNPEAKLLMLRRAFEDLGCLRVQLKCDARNAASRAAILKLGATYEGTLRSHSLLADGHRRDTAFFSVLVEEWPAVQASLHRRLANV